MNGTANNENGMALVTVLLLVALVMSMMLGYSALTSIELGAVRSSMDSTRGFYAAEGGLNIRAEEIRRTFLGYNRPSGTSPDESGTGICLGSNMGSGDFRCLTHDLEDRSVVTFVREPPGNPRSMVVPRGEPYQNLQAQVYSYGVSSIAYGFSGRPEAVLELELESRLIPLFQFAVFYNKDLEVTPGPPLTLSGPVHTNGDLYLAADTTVDILGQVTTGGDLYRGRKEADVCWTGPVSVLDPSTLAELPQCTAGRRRIDESELGPWNGMVRTWVEPVTVPPPEALDPIPGEIYWDRADLRIVLDVTGATPVIQVRRQDHGLHAADSTLSTCAGGTVAETSTSFYNNREGTAIRMLDVDMAKLIDCMHDNPELIDLKSLDDATEGGLVIYLGVVGPLTGMNNYGVRTFNAERLAASDASAPEIRGMTIVTNQAIYVQGHFNRLDKRPAAILGDSLNVLSTLWEDSDATLTLWNADRIAGNTTINAAFLAGTDTTGGPGQEGPVGQDHGLYSGGVHNFPRLHENWTNRTLTYRGSLVSLNNPRHVDGLLIVGPPQYYPPIRDYGYDTDFNDAANLPPLTPRFVYLKQGLFVREFGI